MNLMHLKKIITDDWIRYGNSYQKQGKIRFYLLHSGARISCWLRCYQCSVNNKCRVFCLLSRIKYFLVCKSAGADIPSNTRIGKGLVLAHPCGVVVNSRAIIGDNCTMMSGVIIGQTEKGVPNIGNDVYMGAHAIVIGPVNVGNNVTIGAGAVVVKDVPDNSVVVGNPARCISKNKEGE